MFHGDLTEAGLPGPVNAGPVCFNNNDERKSNYPKPLFGILYMLAGTVLFSIADATGKWLTADYPLIQIGWLRSIGGLLIIGTFALLSGRIAQIKTSRPGQHFLRSLLSAITIFLIFYGLKYIPIAEYVALTFAAPFIIALLSPMVLRKKCPFTPGLRLVSASSVY